jgi:MFS transporter, PPP family, 3-phenylpropionic acid transporter
MNALRLYYFFVFAMYAVVVPHYQLFLAASGYSPREVGLLIGFFEIFGVAGPMVFGSIADRTGRFRELKIAGTMSAGAAFTVLLLRLPLGVAVLVSGIAGFLFKTGVPLTDAVAGTVLSSPREQYGHVRVMGSIGFAVTSVVIPMVGLIRPESPTSILIAFLVSIALFSAVVLVVPPPAHPGTHPFPGTDRSTGSDRTPASDRMDRSTRSDSLPASARRTDRDRPPFPPAFWAVITAIAVANIAFGSYNSFFSLYLRTTLDVQAVTLYWAIGAISEIPIVFYSGKLIRRFGVGPLLIVSGVAMTVRLLAYAMKPALPVVALIQLLHALTFGLMLSAGIAYVNHAVPAARRATGLTIFNAIGMGLAIFIGSILAGYLIETVGFSGMYVLLAVFPAAGTVLIFRLIPRDPYLQR